MRKLVQGSGFKMLSPLKDGIDNQTKTTIDYSNMTAAQKASLAAFWKNEIENYGGIEPGSEGYNELVGANRYAVYDTFAKGKRGETITLDEPRWRMKGGVLDPLFDSVLLNLNRTMFSVAL